MTIIAETYDLIRVEALDCSNKPLYNISSASRALNVSRTTLRKYHYEFANKLIRDYNKISGALILAGEDRVFLTSYQLWCLAKILKISKSNKSDTLVINAIRSKNLEFTKDKYELEQQQW